MIFDIEREQITSNLVFKKQMIWYKYI